MKKWRESSLRNCGVIELKSDLKKIVLKVFNGFKELFVGFFVQIRELISFMAN